MYIPPPNRVPASEGQDGAESDADLRDFVAAHPGAQLITVGPDGLPDATLLPILWRGDRLVAHLAIANPHWRRIEDGAPGLVTVTAAQAYISPSWYAAKAEHGRVVPTWNYSQVQIRGAVHVHRDPEWLRDAVTQLSEEHENPRERPWAVADAPDNYIEAQLRGIVGIELRIDTVEAKAKASQNRSEADRAGVDAGLLGDAEQGLQAEVSGALDSLRTGALPRR